MKSLSFLLCTVAAFAEPKLKTTPAPLPAVEPAREFAVTQATARVVKYGERDVVPVRTRLRFTTLIVLPKGEQILDFICGDKEYWVVNGAENFAHVKPAKAGSRTSLSLIAASGTVYSFVLSEGDPEPDLKVFIEPRDESLSYAIKASPAFVKAAQIDDYRQQVDIARAETRVAKEQAAKLIEKEISGFRSEYPTQLKHDYRFQPGVRPFNVTGIYHDGKFTYIQAAPSETPVVYELRDGKPNLIQFELRNGTYIIPKIIENGYLQIGKEQFRFYRTT